MRDLQPGEVPAIISYGQYEVTVKAKVRWLWFFRRSVDLTVVVPDGPGVTPMSILAHVNKARAEFEQAMA